MNKLNTTLLVATVGITAANVYLLALRVRDMEKSVTSMGNAVLRLIEEPV